MKKKTLALVLAFTMTAALFTGCGSKKETTQTQTETAAETESEEVDDQAAADEVAALIDAICRQEMRTQMSSVQQQKQHGTS